jgi:hypothetical protein
VMGAVIFAAWFGLSMAGAWVADRQKQNTSQGAPVGPHIITCDGRAWRAGFGRKHRVFSATGGSAGGVDAQTMPSRTSSL